MRFDEEFSQIRPELTPERQDEARRDIAAALSKVNALSVLDRNKRFRVQVWLDETHGFTVTEI